MPLSKKRRRPRRGKRKQNMFVSARGRWAELLDGEDFVFPDVYEEYWYGMTFWA